MKKELTGLLTFLLLTTMFFGAVNSAKANSLDSYGYSFKDSNTLGGPVYNWIEINQTGTKILPQDSNWDAYVENVGIGFQFNFYGIDYSQLNVGSGGLLAFAGLPYPTGAPIGNPQNFIPYSPYAFIAPFSDYLYASNLDIANFPSGVYYETTGIAPNRQFIVEWQNVVITSNVTFNSEMGVTFEAILFENSNNILFQYKDTYFGNAFGWSLFHNNGGMAAVGIQDQTGYTGLEYSYNQQVIMDNLAILFEYPTLVASPNLYASINAPAAMDRGEMMTYTVSYCNLGGASTFNTVLSATIPPEVTFDSASANGAYDSPSRTVTWDIGSVAEYPSGYGTQSVVVHIPSSIPLGTLLQGSSHIVSNTAETTYDDNAASVSTNVTGLDIPLTVGIIGEFITSDLARTPIVQNIESITFTYDDSTASAVDISIQINDGGPAITGDMTGPYPDWTYTLTFGARVGDATATFTAHHPTSDDVIETAHIEVVRIDPAGYIYDTVTLQRVSGATVWLQIPNGRGGWTNVLTGQDPAIMDPDINPQTTGANGRYQWDTLPGTYRVHVEAPGYYSADSIAVSVPPPVTDLHVGLVKIPLPQDNSPPTVGTIICPVAPVQVNTLVTFVSSFTDSDTYDTHSAIWVWSDGLTSKATVTETGGVGSVMGGRIFTSAGVYTETLTLTVTDSNGGSSQSTSEQYVVVYDQSAGFVTGGGWINSPAGAYADNPALTGKANFGFVSQYKKGANTPTGNTEFDFHIAGLNFHSKSYDWLVVGGVKAQFKGSGTINGAGNFGFMLTAIDGQLLGKNHVDTFRIKIWDISSGAIVYDNQMGMSDSGYPTTAISGGSIIIHK
jgi:uncharacterized repeat protein (TIGR01451 family)